MTQAVPFEPYFNRATGKPTPHGWQRRLATESTCHDKLIRIPTGFGKTAGVVLAWLWNRVERRDGTWPRRLVLCLPMRTLVEQTHREVAQWLTKVGLQDRVQPHVLMGGLSPSEWHLEPEREAILIGTQDMLLSRALNRGYGTGRARWPMEYGLLNVDCLWVMDEIQLMGVGLATSAQIQAFADQDPGHGQSLPRRTWWMSATLQQSWLGKAPDLTNAATLPLVDLEPDEKKGDLWEVTKTLRVETCPVADDAKAERWADLVVSAHKATNGGVTLAVANTVKSATLIHAAIGKRKKCDVHVEDVDLRLVHSRFRGQERRRWATEFLHRDHCGPGANRIIVATQVVEAGVDISANTLVTEMAPWASLVQRLGRCARYGGSGEVIVVDRRHSDASAVSLAKDEGERRDKRREADGKIVLPYDLGEVEAAAEAIEAVGSSASPAALEGIAHTRPKLIPRLFPYSPIHVLTRRELRDLFDTGPDLTGADVDISRFVREGDERDVTVWWWPVPNGEQPHRRLRPTHDALCRVPIKDAREWLGKGTSEGSPSSEKAESPAKGPPRAWVWSYLDGRWEPLRRQRIYPGLTILVDAAAGGYDIQIGFTGKASVIPVSREHVRDLDTVDAADAADEQDELSEGAPGNDRQYKTIATHGAEVAAKAHEIAANLRLDQTLTKLLGLAGIAHDVGKAHPAFAGAIRDRNGIPTETPLAKAPVGRWHAPAHAYDHSHLGKRPGFRHELASALAIIECTWRASPTHPALQGGREKLLDMTIGSEAPAAGERIQTASGLLADLLALDAQSFDLVAYLVLAHHGKVRATMPMSPHDQEQPGPLGDLPIRGVRDGDTLPALLLLDAAGREFDLPQLTLRLDPARLGLSRRYGPSWVERVLALRKLHGDFRLAWLEALLRVADVRASRIHQPLDPRLKADLAVVPANAPVADRNADLRQWIDNSLAAYDDPASAEAGSAGKDTRKNRKGQKASAERPAKGAKA